MHEATVFYPLSLCLEHTQKSFTDQKNIFLRKKIKILKEYIYVCRQIYIYNHFVETCTLYMNYTELKIVQ